MDTRSLACFIAVAEQKHFRRAAQLLNMTQPTLSQRIRMLEQEIGVALFERDRRHVELTASGRAFIEPARAALASLTLAIRQARAALRGEVGQLRLGFTVIASYSAVPAAVREFRTAYPDVRVELVERNSPALEVALLTGEIDLAILHPPLASGQLGTSSLPAERLMLALPADHHLAGNPQVTMADLAGEELLIAPRLVGPRIYDRIIAHFQAAGVSPNIVQEVTPMTTLVGLVAAGVGTGFVTQGIARVARSGVAFVEVVPEPPRLPIVAAWLGKAPDATSALFLEIMRSQAGAAK